MNNTPKLCKALYGVAMFLIFGTALCADGLADIPHGFLIMFICIGVAALLLRLCGRLEDSAGRTKKPPAEVTL